jgi:hypothetical protein
MPIVKMERMDDLGCVERHGTIRSLTRKARVLFTEMDNAPTNFHILNEALAVCPQPFSTPPTLTFGNVDVPAVNQQSFPTNPNDRYGALVLVGRDPKIAENEKWCVDVTLHYEHMLDGPNQKLFNPTSGMIWGKGKTSVSDKSTNFYYPFGDTTKAREIIQVAHTFPTNDNGIAGLPLDPTMPRTIIQGGEINIPFPQSNFRIHGYVLNEPNIVDRSFEFVAKINENVWLGRPALTWLCSEMEWECVSPSTFLYKVSFEFQYNIDTWDATVVFIDQRTGKPPATVQKATTPDSNSVLRKVAHPTQALTLTPAGMWQVPSLGRVDFNQKFSAFFNGSNPAGMA